MTMQDYQDQLKQTPSIAATAHTVPSRPLNHMELKDLTLIPFGTYREKRDWLEELDMLQSDDGTPMSETFEMLEHRIANFDEVIDSNLDPLEVLDYIVDFITPDSQKQSNRPTKRSKARGRR